MTETICPEMLGYFPFCIIISSFGSHSIRNSVMHPMYKYSIFYDIILTIDVI